jgi:hypothetical protein
VEFLGDSVMVYEYFEASNEGPVSYGGHYEGILIEKTNNNWLISSLLDDSEVDSLLLPEDNQLNELLYTKSLIWEDYLYMLTDKKGNDLSIFTRNTNQEVIREISNNHNTINQSFLNKKPLPSFF